MTTPAALRAHKADVAAVRKLVGCQHPEPCPWMGVVIVTTITGSAATDRTWRACRAHAAECRDLFGYRVRDTGAPNRRIDWRDERIK